MFVSVEPIFDPNTLDYEIRMTKACVSIYAHFDPDTIEF